MKDHRATAIGFAILVVLVTAGAAQGLSRTDPVEAPTSIVACAKSTPVIGKAVSSTNRANERGEPVRAANVDSTPSADKGERREDGLRHTPAQRAKELLNSPGALRASSC